MTDFADIRARIPTDEVEELVLIEYIGCFRQYKLRHVDVGFFVRRVYGSYWLVLLVVALFAPHQCYSLIIENYGRTLSIYNLIGICVLTLQHWIISVKYPIKIKSFSNKDTMKYNHFLIQFAFSRNFFMVTFRSL